VRIKDGVTVLSEHLHKLGNVSDSMPANVTTGGRVVLECLIEGLGSVAECAVLNINDEQRGTRANT
jgi:hypothetical protein